MKIGDLLQDKDVFLFELDNVLFDKRDYLVQVYYLFGSFYEFTVGTITANEIATFMARIYDLHGEDQVFLSTKVMFDMDEKYQDNYQRLLANAQIPFKLALFRSVKDALLSINESKKKIAILTKGNPVEQLNKLKFIDWEEMEFVRESLRVYFVDELEFRNINPIEFVANAFNVQVENVIHIKNNLKENEE